MNIIEARRDPNLFGKLHRDPATWRAWDTILKAAFALPMDRAERRLFKTLAKRKPPRKPVRDLWVIAGRRGGKTSAAGEVADSRSVSSRIKDVGTAGIGRKAAAFYRV